MKAFVVLVIAVSLSQFAIGQNASTFIEGKVIDKKTKQVLMFANIVLYKTGSETFETGIETDLDGNYSIYNLDSGFYDVKISYVGYLEQKVTKVKIENGKTTTLNIELSEGKPSCIVHWIYVEPLIRFDYTTSGRKYTSEDLRNSPMRN